MKYAIVILMTIYAAKVIRDEVVRCSNLPPCSDENSKKNKTID